MYQNLCPPAEVPRVPGVGEGRAVTVEVSISGRKIAAVLAQAPDPASRTWARCDG